MNKGESCIKDQLLFEDVAKLKQRFYQKIRSSSWPTALLLLSSCITFLILLIPMTIMVMLRSMTGLFLRYRYGKKYGGILQSSDAIWAADDDESKAIINALYVLNSDTKDVQKLRDKIKRIFDEKIFRKPDDFPKLTSIRSSCMGFTFLIKGEFSIDECMTKVDSSDNDYYDQSMLTEILGDYSNKPLPKNNNALWEVIILPKPIKWNQKENETQFLMLVRINHIVGDGMSLINFLLKNFADDKTTLMKNIKNPSIANETKSSTIYDRLKKIVFWIYIILITPPTQLRQNFLMEEDVNCLHGSKLSGKKILVYNVEKKSALIPLVKEMKRSLPKTTFSDIVYTAISSSLSEYFQKNSPVVPKSTTVAVPALLSVPDTNATTLRNQFSVGLLELPISSKPQSTIMSTLQDVKRCTSILRSSPDYLVNDFLLQNFCGIIPAPILKRYIKTDHLTLSISNLPGIPKVSIFDGCLIEDFVFFPPHRGKTGVSFSVLTYNDRFQFGLAVDEALISSYVEAQSIVDNISRRIYRLYEEFTEQVLPSTKVKE